MFSSPAVACLLLLFAGCVFFVPAVRGAGPIITFNLNARASEKIWVARGLNGTKAIQVPASVPGGIYSDLEAAGGIFDSPIYYRYNDRETRWVGRTDWNFSRRFEVSAALLSKTKVVLVCEGLDTVSKVFINGVLVGSSVNMFVRYLFDIKEALKVGNNTLRVQFEAPVLYAQRQWDSQKKDYPVFPDCFPDEFQGECHANHIRKMQASFAWDWGPSYPSSGIWKNISIQGFDGGVIRDVTWFTIPNQPIPDQTANTTWKLSAQIWVDLAANCDQSNKSGNPEISSTLTVTLRRRREKSGAANSNTVFVMKQRLDLKVGHDSSQPIEVKLPDLPGSDAGLWWPNGYGAQQLYDLELKHSFDHTPDEETVKNITVGIRSVELIQDPVDKSNLTKGLEFYFKVNGVPIYAKGSNAVPIHVLPERATPAMTRWLFESSKEAHFNMVRVWGGGIYESEEFYQYADEFGILVWQDFMFACAMYPTSPPFLETVGQEVATQVKRLQHHASVAIWAANNENEAALRGNWYGTATNFSLYAADYVKLYIQTVQDLVKKLDPSRSVLSSSPTNGKESEAEGWIALNPYSTLYGDDHFYNYQADGWDHRIAPLTRFASEYGYQSWPSLETLRTATSEQLDWAWNSSMSYHRQHHPGGQLEMQHQIQKHLPIPANSNSTQAFGAMLYLAQINQAMAVKIQTERYRRLKGEKFDSGEGHNMGALYWQLNDIWPGASWAGIESTGRWKMLHYFARNFFAPVIISPFDSDNGDIVVHLVSDLMTTFKNDLRVRLFRLDSLTPLFDYRLSVSAAPLSAGQVHLIPAQKVAECRNSLSNCLLHFSMPGVPSNFLLLEYPNSYPIPNPKLRIVSVRKSPDVASTFIVRLKTEEVASFVFLNLRANEILGSFSDNGFMLVDCSTEVTFRSKVPLTLSHFRKNLQVSTLYDFVHV